MIRIGKTDLSRGGAAMPVHTGATVSILSNDAKAMGAKAMGAKAMGAKARGAKARGAKARGAKARDAGRLLSLRAPRLLFRITQPCCDKIYVWLYGRAGVSACMRACVSCDELLI